MTDVLKTILFFLLIWWVLQFLSRLVTTAPAGNKKTNSGFNPFQQKQQHSKKEGETSISYKSKAHPSKSNTNNSGEYVDYEEVK